MQVEAVVDLLDAQSAFLGIRNLPQILIIVLGPLVVVLSKHGFEAVWVEGCLVYGILGDGRPKLLAKHLLELSDLHGLLPNIFDVLHLLLFLQSLSVLPFDAHLDSFVEVLLVGFVCALRIADALVLVESLGLLCEMGLRIVELIRGFEAVVIEEVSHPILSLHLLVEVFSEFPLHLLPLVIKILMTRFVLGWIALVASDLRLEELFAFLRLVFFLFHGPLFVVYFVVLLPVSDLSELTTNSLSIRKFVISCQVVGLLMVAQGLALEVFEESLESVKLCPVHGRFLLHISVIHLLAVYFLLVLRNPGLYHQRIDGRFLRICVEEIFDASAV